MRENKRNKDLDVNQIEIKVPEKKEDPIMCALILAIFKMPFMHRLTQSMAENTYVRSKGQNIIKTKIDKNTSNTLEQQMQRLRMKQLIYLCKVLNTPIHSSFPERKRTETEWNAFIRAAMPSISVSEDLEVSVDYETLLIAQGSLEVVEEVSITQDAEANTLTVTYQRTDRHRTIGAVGEREDAQQDVPSRHARGGLHGNYPSPQRLDCGKHQRVCLHAFRERAKSVQFDFRPYQLRSPAR